MSITRIIALLLTVTWAVAEPARAYSTEGVEFTDHYEWNGTPMRLNGAGVLHYRIFFKGYVAALYLGEGVTAEQALEDIPRRIEIEYLWSIPAEAFARATVEGITRNVDSATFERLREPIARLNALYEDVEPGDRYAITYVPEIGTELALNGEPKGLIEGAELSAALFAIWIGEQAISEPLREQLLSQAKAEGSLGPFASLSPRSRGTSAASVEQRSQFALHHGEVQEIQEVRVRHPGRERARVGELRREIARRGEHAARL